jgi:hypothetical protein
MKLFAPCLLIAPAVLAQWTVQQPVMHDVPLLDCRGLPCVELSTHAGKTLKLVIDTAEPNSYLDTKAAQALDANPKPIKSENDTDISQVQQTTVAGAQLGDLPMGDFPFMVLDTTPDANGAKGKTIPPFPADGALGFRGLDNRIVKIDYGHHVIRISEPLDAAQPCPQACTDLIVKHFGGYGPVTLTTTGFSVNGQAVDVQLDTQFAGTMLIYPDFVKKLGLKKLAKSKHKEFFPFVQGGLSLAQAEGATEAWQSTQFGANTPIYFFDSDDAHTNPVNFDATVGSGMFAQSVAVFDFRGKHFWVETPAQ